MTILLRRSDLESLLDVDACLGSLRAGFLAAAEAVPAQRVRTDLPGPGTATALIPGLLDGVPAYTVKVNAKFPEQRPALRGVVCLHDLCTGELLAVLDSATVTAWRTGLAAALATHLLAAPDRDELGVIGAGAQARLVVRGLSKLRSLRRLVIHDLDGDRAREFAATAAAGLPEEIVDDPGEVARRCRIIVLATWSRRPLLGRDQVLAGTQLTSLGTDEPGKVELAADLVGAATLVVDDVSLATSNGLLRHAPVDPSEVVTMRDVMTGRAAGRVRARDVSVYAPVGLPWQDLALSWQAYEAARAAGVGTVYDWLG